jgi:hypothetical protein
VSALLGRLINLDPAVELVANDVGVAPSTSDEGRHLGAPASVTPHLAKIASVHALTDMRRQLGATMIHQK